MKKLFFLAVIQLAFYGSPGMIKDSVPELPVVVLPAKGNTNGPMVLLITGDGGWKGFDPVLSNQFVEKNIPVVALNALHYFWKKKTPEQATEAAEYLLKKYLKQWHKNAFILAGFSFGADVLPFIVNRLPASLLKYCEGVTLFSPGISTDFEIHVSQMLGQKQQWKYDVVREIQQMKQVKTLFFLGKEDRFFPVKTLSVPPSHIIYLDEKTHRDIAAIVLKKLG